MLEALAYLLIGALAGLLAGLFGIGGGAVMVPALVFVFDLSRIGGDWAAHLAVGSSLAAIVGTGLASMLAHRRHGSVRWDLVWLLAPGILLGALAGSMLAAWLPGVWLKRLFALFLTLTGMRLVASPTPAKGPSRPLPKRAGLIAAGGAIGAFSALVGIGGGTLTVPFLNRYGIDLRQAIGTSAACGVPIALAGALGFVLNGWGRDGLPSGATGFVYWPAVLWMSLSSYIAAPLGARLAHRLPIQVLKRLFGALLILIALRLASG